MAEPWLDIDVPPWALGFLAPGIPVDTPAKLKPLAKIPPWLKGAGWIGAGIIAIDILEDLPWGDMFHPWGGRHFGKGWTVCCTRTAPPVPSGYPLRAIKDLGAPPCNIVSCNHPGALLFLGTTLTDPSARHFYDARVNAMPDGNGFIVGEYVRAVAAPVIPRPYGYFLGHGTTAREFADPAAAVNPNVSRRLGGNAQSPFAPDIYVPDGAPVADPAPDFMEGVPHELWPSPAIRITVRPVVAPAPSVGRPVPRPIGADAPVTGPGTDPGTDPGHSVPDPGGSAPPGTVTRTWPSHPRQRPPRRTKERKVKSRALRFFDLVSEAGDAVDCFYKALPKATRKKWDKKQSRSSKMGENFGQYGFGGADYKLPALYHNWDAVDLRKAMTCLVTNEIEDRIIGKIAAKSRGTAFGVSQTFRNLKNWKG